LNWIASPEVVPFSFFALLLYLLTGGVPKSAYNTHIYFKFILRSKLKIPHNVKTNSQRAVLECQGNIFNLPYLVQIRFTESYSPGETCTCKFSRHSFGHLSCKILLENREDLLNSLHVWTTPFNFLG
jgi:hypothetical protein